MSDHFDTVFGRGNMRGARRIDRERPHLTPLPTRRVCGHGMRVPASGGFLGKVFYTLPSGLIGHRLRARLYDDRVEVFADTSALITLSRGRPDGKGRHDQVVNNQHVIHALRRRPIALMNLVYRDQPFPREAFAAWRSGTRSTSSWKVSPEDPLAI